MKRFLTLFFTVVLLFLFASCTTYSTAVSPTFASGTSASSGAGTAKPEEPAEAPALQEPTEQAPEAEERPEELPPCVSDPVTVIPVEVPAAQATPRNDTVPQTTARSYLPTSATSVRPTPGMSTASVISIPVPTGSLGLSVSTPVRLTPEQYIRYCQQRTALAPSSAVFFPDLEPKKPEAPVPPGARLWP